MKISDILRILLVVGILILAWCIGLLIFKAYH